MYNWFIRLHLWIDQNKGKALLLAFLWLIIAGFFASRITFEEDITRIIPKNEKTTQAAQVLQQVRFADKIAVIIEKKQGATADDLVTTATAFLDSLEVAQPYIKNIQGKVDEAFLGQAFGFVYQNLPLFLDSEDYAHLKQQIASPEIEAKMQENFELITSPMGGMMQDFIMKDPLGLSFIALKKMQKMHATSAYTMYNGFLVTADTTQLLLFIDPVLSGTETEKNTHFVQLLYDIQKQLNTQFVHTTVDYFGSSLIAVANAERIKKDIITTILISMGTLLVVLMLFYKRFLIPIVIFIPSLFGALTALAIMSLLKDSFSAISISIGAILLGITIDYSLHILTHYKSTADVRVLYKEITKPLIMSSSTTAIAFVCLFFVHSEALVDLGLFASITIMVSALFSLLLVPHLYRPKASATSSRTVIDRLAGFSFHKSRFLQLSSIGLIVLSFFTYKNVSFDNDLSKLNYVPEALQLAEKKLEATVDSKTKALYITAYGTNAQEVLEHNTQVLGALQHMNTPVSSIQSVGNFLLTVPKQQQKIAQWEQFWTDSKKQQLAVNLKRAASKYGFSTDAFDEFEEVLQKKFQPLTLQDYQQQASFLIDEFLVEKNGFYTLSTLIKIPEVARTAFFEEWKAPQATLLVDRQEMSESFLGALVKDFNDLVNYSFLAVLLILWLFFKRIELVLISAVPIAITGWVTAGLMGAFDIPLNIFSSIVCTLIFGHGVDFSIFMTSALQKEYTTGKNELPTYRTSIILAVLTTLLAIGALVFAQHPALKSISLVSLIGVFSALIITFVFYPFLFKWLIANRPQKGLSPVSLSLVLQSVVFFIYYAVFGVLLSLFLRILLLVLPLSKTRKYKTFSWFMSRFMTSVLYLKPSVKKRLINPYSETFKKPAIIIANHTSFLDTLAIGMYHPNIVFMVNDWVYRSPIFGRAVRLAGFYPVSQGIENSIEPLKKRMGTTFSLMIFPEGTRSTSNAMGRFHKGAFYLAEQLQLDVVPVYLQGTSEVIPKGDFIIYDGQIVNYIDERIAPYDHRFGSSYSERTKKISAYCKQKFTAVRQELEDENYFQQKLFLSFLYKDQGVVQAVRTDFKQNKSIYYLLFTLLQPNEKILHWANDYGQLDFLLVMQHATRTVISFIEDDEKRAIAQTNYIVKKRKLNYITLSAPIEKQCTTLLISTNQPIENVPNCIQKIVTLHRVQQHIEGFTWVKTQDALHVYQKTNVD